MRTWHALLFALVSLALVLGSSGRHTPRAAMADRADMAMDTGEVPSAKSIAEKCGICGKSDVAKLPCLPICISAPALVPEGPPLRVDMADATLSPIKEWAMSGSTRAPDPYPPKTIILA